MNDDELKELLAHSKANTYISHGDTSKADCVLVFSFGYRTEHGRIAPGLSNEDLASFIDSRFPELPIIAQFEIGDKLSHAVPALIIREHREAGKYLDSPEVIAQAKAYMEDRGWSKAIVVTHPAMEARNDYACTAQGIETIAPSGLEGIRYDAQSEQEWTRNGEAWWSREEGVIQFAYDKGLLKKPRDLKSRDR